MTQQVRQLERGKQSPTLLPIIVASVRGVVVVGAVRPGGHDEERGAQGQGDVVAKLGRPRGAERGISNLLMVDSRSKPEASRCSVSASDSTDAKKEIMWERPHRTAAPPPPLT